MRLKANEVGISRATSPAPRIVYVRMDEPDLVDFLDVAGVDVPSDGLVWFSVDSRNRLPKQTYQIISTSHHINILLKSAHNHQNSKLLFSEESKIDTSALWARSAGDDIFIICKTYG